MRRIHLASSFDAEFLALSAHVKERFGGRVALEFADSFSQRAQTLAGTPGLGKTNHGFHTVLYAIVFRAHWLFYRFTDDKIEFLHIRSGRMQKEDQRFEA